MHAYLDFEAPLAELEGKIAELKAIADPDSSVSTSDEVKALEKKAAKSLADLYQSLTPWQKAQVARHPDRPHSADYISALITDYTPMAGDRKFGEDNAIVGGLGRIGNRPVHGNGQEQRHDTQTRLKHNFGIERRQG